MHIPWYFLVSISHEDTPSSFHTSIRINFHTRKALSPSYHKVYCTCSTTSHHFHVFFSLLSATAVPGIYTCMYHTVLWALQFLAATVQQQPHFRILSSLVTATNGASVCTCVCVCLSTLKNTIWTTAPHTLNFKSTCQNTVSTPAAAAAEIVSSGTTVNLTWAPAHRNRNSCLYYSTVPPFQLAMFVRSNDLLSRFSHVTEV